MSVPALAVEPEGLRGIVEAWALATVMHARGLLAEFHIGEKP
jgi:hypothetical protein